MAADYAAGEEAIAGFKKGFEEGGGKLVGEAKTPFGTTQDFQPFLAKARSAKPGRGLRVLRGRRGRVLRQAVRGVRALRQRAAVRLRLPHRGRRADGAGRRRRGRQDRAALRDRARQPGQQELRRGLPGQDRQAADRLRRAGVGRRGRARQGGQGGGRARRRRAVGGARQRRRDRRQPARPVELREPEPGRRRCTCARCAPRATP